MTKENPQVSTEVIMDRGWTTVGPEGLLGLGASVVEFGSAIIKFGQIHPIEGLGLFVLSVITAYTTSRHVYETGKDLISRIR